MTSSPASSTCATPAAARSGWLLALVLALVWLPAIRQWSYDWSTNPQYYYGWAVPFLAAYLFYERWLLACPFREPRHRGWVFASVVMLAALQWPARWFGEANSDWWPVWWIYGAICIGVSLGTVYLLWGGGRVRQLAFPILFMATAIPWPTYFELNLVQQLMGIDAAISAEIVSAMGVPAVAVGNTIEVPSGVLGVDEACSGIRSLQSTFMAALFLGGLYRLSLAGGAVLVFIGVTVAFVCNVVRTTFLTFQGAAHGVQATEKWHDTAGFVILGVVLVVLFGISQFLDRATARRGKGSAA